MIFPSTFSSLPNFIPCFLLPGGDTAHIQHPSPRDRKIHMVVKHVVGFQSPPVDTLSFLLTLLASVVTPVFVLSKRWTHLPCGCIINCQPDAYSVAFDGKKSKRKGFEFNLSFQQGYGIYKISHADYYEDDENAISYHNLKNSECEATKEPGGDNRSVFNAITVEISTAPPLDSGTLLSGINKCTNTDIPEPRQGFSEEKSAFPVKTESEINCEETTSFEGPERRLSHEESHKPELSDWEWCRSKSERTPRQLHQLQLSAHYPNTAGGYNVEQPNCQIAVFLPDGLTLERVRVFLAASFQ